MTDLEDYLGVELGQIYKIEELSQDGWKLMKKTNLEQEETKSLHPGEEADSLHVQGFEVPHSAAVL